MIEQQYPSTLFAELYDKQQSIDDILRNMTPTILPMATRGSYELRPRSALFGKLRSATTQVKTVQDELRKRCIH